MILSSILAMALFLHHGQPAAKADPDDLARTWIAAVEALNAEHARKPGDRTEAELAAKLPKRALTALDTLLASGAEGAPAALVLCAESALDIDRVADFERIRARLAQTSPEDAQRIGIVLSRPRYLMRGLAGVEPEGLAAVAAALDEILAAYDAVFGFDEWSKVPGKKLRVRVHLVETITRPPHFAPQFPWHSEIDFPVVDPRGFASPTDDGKFQLYGLCHELGHVIAMWGDRQNQEDHHAWAHYTGVTIVEHLAAKNNHPALARLRDARWRSLGLERKRLAEKGVAPGRDSEDQVLALFMALHDAVGPRVVGDAIDALDAKGDCLRVNRVRYYGLDAFGKALLETPAGKEKRRELAALLR